MFAGFMTYSIHTMALEQSASTVHGVRPSRDTTPLNRQMGLPLFVRPLVAHEVKGAGQLSALLHDVVQKLKSTSQIVSGAPHRPSAAVSRDFSSKHAQSSGQVCSVLQRLPEVQPK